MPDRDAIYRWVRCDNERGRLWDVGILWDGSLHNPNNYPEDIVRSAVTAAEEERHARLSASAKRAAETRRRRQERRVHEMAERLLDGDTFEDDSYCRICGKALDDPESRERGIGSDCWQRVLERVEMYGREVTGAQGQTQSPAARHA